MIGMAQDRFVENLTATRDSGSYEDELIVASPQSALVKVFH